MAEPGFVEGFEELCTLALDHPTAVLCAEQLPERCHRRFIMKALEREGFEVKHLVEVGAFWIPQPGLFDEDDD